MMGKPTHSTYAPLLRRGGRDAGHDLGVGRGPRGGAEGHHVSVHAQVLFVVAPERRDHELWVILGEQHLLFRGPVVEPRGRESTRRLVGLHQAQHVVVAEFARQSPAEVVAERVTDLEHGAATAHRHGHVAQRVRMTRRLGGSGRRGRRRRRSGIEVTAPTRLGERRVVDVGRGERRDIAGRLRGRR